jgi:hypothetical protein
MRKTIWEVAHDAIFDAWQSKVWGKLQLGLKLREFETSHFDTLFTPLSFQAMPFTGKYQSVEIYYSG